MARVRTRIVKGPVYDFVNGGWIDPTPAPVVLSTRAGFGGLAGPGGNPQAGRQDRDLQRFHGRKGPRGTQERLPGGHGGGDIGHFADKT
ncbi:MAG: hypothetical protein V7607_1218 [Solirubrobacteraceae bacterium]